MRLNYAKKNAKEAQKGKLFLYCLLLFHRNKIAFKDSIEIPSDTCKGQIAYRIAFHLFIVLCAFTVTRYCSIVCDRVLKQIVEINLIKHKFNRTINTVK